MLKKKSLQIGLDSNMGVAYLGQVLSLKYWNVLLGQNKIQVFLLTFFKRKKRGGGTICRQNFFLSLVIQNKVLTCNNGCPNNGNKHFKVEVCMSRGNSIFLSLDINLHILNNLFVLFYRFLY